MIGSIEELERLAATSGSLIVDCKGLTNMALINIVTVVKVNGGTITLTNIRGKSIDALEEIGKAGGKHVIFDTR